MKRSPAYVAPSTMSTAIPTSSALESASVQREAATAEPLNT